MEVSLSADDVSKCRCCMGPSVSAKDLSREYDWMGEKEVYADMLLESFDIKLLRQMAAGWTICDSCITRLRDSSNFKKQVLYSEKCLLQKLNSGQGTAKDEGGEGKPDVSLMKHESTESDDEDRNDLFETHFYEDDNEEEEFKHVSVKLEPVASTSTELSNDEDIPLSSLTAGVKRKAPAKTAKSAVAAKQPKLTVNTIKQNIRQRYEQLVKNTTTARKIPIKTAPSKFLPIKSMPAKKTALLKISGQKMSGQKILGQRPPVQKILGQRPSGQKILGQRPLGQKAEQGDTAQAALLKLSGRPLKITLKNPTTAAVKKGLQSMQAAARYSTIKMAMNARKERGKHFTVAVLTHSDATPFLIRRKKFIKCIYNCYEELDPESLRTHTRTKHNASLHRAAKGVHKSVLRVDITDLHCTVCCLPVNNLDELQNHLSSEHKITTYKNSADVLVPYRLSTTNYACQLCNEVSDSLFALDSHMGTHFALNICEVCGQGFMDPKQLKLHSEIHAEKSFICEICNAPFLTDTQRKRHLNYIHKGIGLLKCWICPGDVRFKNHNDKLEHMEQVHNVEKRPTPTCPDCHKVFKHISSLNVHIRNFHQIMKPHKCKECNEYFHKKRELDSHVRLTHTGDMLECPHCEKSYYCVKEWSKHMARIHSDQERRCPCSKCGVPCENRYKLKLHMIEHHNAYT